MNFLRAALILTGTCLCACSSDPGTTSVVPDMEVDQGAQDLSVATSEDLLQHQDHDSDAAADLPQRDADNDLSSPVDMSADASPKMSVMYVEVTDTHLPEGLGGLNMDVVSADMDGDGDLDLVIAHEFARNILLLNDGSGVFTDASASWFPNTSRDSEDLAVADWDGDGALDVLVVSEDDRVNELFLQRDGALIDASDRLPNEGTSNGVTFAVLSGDLFPTIFVGNNGTNRLWRSDGKGGFRDETMGRLPPLEDATQDLELGDVDGDGDLDLVIGNEGANLLLLQQDGVFTQAPDGCLPLREAPEETRDVELGDIDGDGDLDLVFGNVLAFVPGADPGNRVLINQGNGCFVDETTTRLEVGRRSTFDADLVDLDGDGDLDLVTGNLAPSLSLGTQDFRAYRNDGTGRFSDATVELFGEVPRGKGFDIEAFDADGDGLLDLYFASRGAPDRLFLRRHMTSR